MVARCISVRSSTECHFLYAHMWGWSALVFSNACESCCDTSTDMYASIVSRSDMGCLSVSDPGLGMGMRSVCLAADGRIRCMSASCMIFPL